jgi:hypothetical protein
MKRCLTTFVESTLYCTFLTIGLLHVALGCKPNHVFHRIANLKPKNAMYPKTPIKSAFFACSHNTVLFRPTIQRFFYVTLFKVQILFILAGTV